MTPGPSRPQGRWGGIGTPRLARSQRGWAMELDPALDALPRPRLQIASYIAKGARMGNAIDSRELALVGISR